MEAVLQRVSEAQVRVDGAIVGAIGAGALVLLGVGQHDGEREARWIANRIAGLRMFADETGKMNCSVREMGGGLLVVSQFTLLGDTSSGRRPGFSAAAPPAVAEPLYERVLELLAEEGVDLVERGRFGANMRISAVLDGPVTLRLTSPPRPV
jgi:D-tyrosyl-tRNA(Tyr) deacylase